MEEPTYQPKGNPQKGILFAVFLLALFAVIFGIVRLRQTLFRAPTPIAATGTTTNRSSPLPTFPSAPAALTSEELRTKDTDGDGLSDYDELQIYRTSPYLKDSDSDGFDDKTEIASKNDPNCPKGTTCTPSSLPSSGTTQLTIPSLLPELPSSSPSADIPPFSPELLRASLRQQGVSEEQLQGIDDAALKEIYDEAVQEVRAEKGTATAPSQGLPAADVGGQAPSPRALLENMSPNELRALLKQSGIPETFLNTIDDATIQAIVREALDKLKD